MIARRLPLSSNALFWWGIVGLLMLASVGPFVWLLKTALTPPHLPLFGPQASLLPTALTLENVVAVWQRVPFLAYTLNSVGVSVVAVIINLGISILAAYPLARMRFRGQSVALLVLMGTMMLPFQVILVPLFQLVQGLGVVPQDAPLTGWAGLWQTLTHSPMRWVALSIPFAISSFGIMMVRQAMLGLPRDLDDAAQLDGCSPWQTLWSVWVPILRPTLVTLALLTVLATWGEILWPSLLLSQQETYTLPMGLVYLQSSFSSNWRWVASGALMGLVPVLVLFWGFQRALLGGQLAGAVKE